MKQSEANSIMKFLDKCEKFLSNTQMMKLCNALEIANDDVLDEVQSAIWWNASGHYDKAFKKEFEV